MARMKLSLETLKDFDFGKAAVAWQKAMEAVVRDVIDRPGDKKPRTVELVAHITPIMQQDGDVVDAEVFFTVKHKVPSWRTADRPLAVSGQALMFNDMAPDNPHQSTIDE